MAPPPCASLSYASEQPATEDLKGREKSMHAHHDIVYGQKPPEVQYLASWARAGACRQRGIGECMTEVYA